LKNVPEDKIYEEIMNLLLQVCSVVTIIGLFLLAESSI